MPTATWAVRICTGGQQRNFPVLESTCGISNSAQAYSFNFTAIPRTRSLGYLTVWPEGQPQPLVSTLNDPTGTIVANAAIVPAGTSGGITVYPTDDTDLAIDVNGYFAPAGTGGLSLYVLTPCRVLDTRHEGGAFTGKLVIDVLNSVCAPPSSAKAYVFNATVVPQGSLGYLALWPDGQPQPVVSTLNAPDGSITSNMAIVPASTQGKIDAYAAERNNTVADGYFQLLRAVEAVDSSQLSVVSKILPPFRQTRAKGWGSRRSSLTCFFTPRRTDISGPRSTSKQNSVPSRWTRKLESFRKN